MGFFDRLPAFEFFAKTIYTNISWSVLSLLFMLTSYKGNYCTVPVCHHFYTSESDCSHLDSCIIIALPNEIKTTPSPRPQRKCQYLVIPEFAVSAHATLLPCIRLNILSMLQPLGKELQHRRTGVQLFFVKYSLRSEIAGITLKTSSPSTRIFDDPFMVCFF